MNRHKLIKKLKLISIKSVVEKWFSLCLQHCNQCVKFGSAIFSHLSLRDGVPQRIVPGPLLFLVYINGIIKLVNYSKIQPFVDDTILHISSLSYSHIVSGSQLLVISSQQLTNISMHLLENELFILLVTRIWLSHHSFYKNTKIIMNNVELPLVIEIKYLVVFLRL